MSNLERDIRDHASWPVTPDLEVPSSSEDLPAAVRRRARDRNAFTGTRAVLEAPSESPDDADLVARAVAAVTSATRSPRARSDDAPEVPLEVMPDPAVVRTSAGTRIVHLHQHHHGVPVYEAIRSACYRRDGAVEIVGDHVPLASGLSPEPALAAADAVRAAASYLATATATSEEPIEVSPDLPRLIVSFPLPGRPSVLSKPPFADPVTAHLVWLHCAPGDTRLGWLVSLSLPDGSDQYDLIVAAGGDDKGEVLYCKGSYACARGHGRVFRHDPDDPDGRLDVDLPLPRKAYPDFAGAGPSDPLGMAWIEEDRTHGNNAAVFRGNRKTSTLQGIRDGEVVTFAPADPKGQDQCLLNAFYFCNYLHDFFALLGFGEAEGNFQQQNFTGAAGDRDGLEVRVFDVPVAGMARMRARRDGRPGELQLGSHGERHGALDADLVCHEYAHGVSNRLAGGRMSFEPLRHPESRALGEGYSDYFAITLRSWQQGDEKGAFGAWLALNDEAGLRRNAYDDDFPLHYGDLLEPENQEPHNGGEVWCAALARMNRAIGRALGDPDRGHQVGWQLVVDSIKLLPVGPDQPGFLDARDALSRALADLGAAGRLDADDHAAVERAVLAAFAATGMGPGAVGRGARFRVIVPDFTGAESGVDP